MNIHNLTILVATEEPMYKQYKPSAKDLIALPKAAVYLLMAVVVVVGVAYAIVGHLIKDLAIDIAECMLGPVGDEDKDNSNPQHINYSHLPAVHPFAHNAFHVWDPDAVIVSLPSDESPLASPLLLSGMPHIPSFFPHTHSPTGHGSMTFSNGPSPLALDEQCKKCSPW